VRSGGVMQGRGGEGRGKVLSVCLCFFGFGFRFVYAGMCVGGRQVVRAPALTHLQPPVLTKHTAVVLSPGHT
jgi:hypothetical protein